MDNTELERTASLIKFKFRAPNPLVVSLWTLILAFLIGIIVLPKELALAMKIYQIVLLFLLPTLLAGISSTWLARIFKGKLYLRRSFLLAFLSLIILGFEVYIIKTLTNNILLALILGYSSILWFRQIIILGISNSNSLLALPSSIVQSLLGIVFIWSIYQPTTQFLVLTLILSTIFLSSAIVFVEIAKLPIKRKLGIDPLKLLKATLAHFTEGSLALENILESSFGESEIAEIKVVVFRSENSKKLKTLLVLPENIHPGPFGKLGGSNLPAKLTSKLDLPALVLHSCSTHDFNPISSAECSKLETTLNELLAKPLEYRCSGSKYVAVYDDELGIQVSAQYLNNTLLMICSFELPIDDLDPLIRAQVISLRAHEPNTMIIFANAHSCLTKDAETLKLNSEHAHTVVKLAEEAILKAKETKGYKLRVGLSKASLKASDLGELGIQTLVIEAGEQKTCYLLFDGNGMRKELKAELKSSLAGLVNELEVLTTDNHAVNITMQSFNPVGSSNVNYITIAKNIVQEALSNLEAIELAGISEKTEIKVTGRGSTEKLSSSINSTISLLKILFPAVLIITILTSILTVCIFY